MYFSYASLSILYRIFQRLYVLSLTSWSTVYIEKLIVAKLVNKLVVFYGTGKSLAVFTRARTNNSFVHLLSSVLYTEDSPRNTGFCGTQSFIVSLMALHR
jgi:hypothetical protein